MDQRDFFENFLLNYLASDPKIMDTYDLYAESKTKGGLINKEEDINFDEIKEYLVAIRPLMPWKPNKKRVDTSFRSIYSLVLERSYV